MVSVLNRLKNMIVGIKRGFSPVMLSCLLILLLIAWKTEQILSFLNDDPQASTADFSMLQGQDRNAATTNNMPISRLISLNIFGNPVATAALNSTPAKVELPQGPPPQSRLPIELLGVVVSTRPIYSSAVVSVNKKEPKKYLIGDYIMDDTRLDDVQPNYVIIARGNSLESIFLNQKRPTTATTRTPNAVNQASDNSRNNNSFDLSDDVKFTTGLRNIIAPILENNTPLSDVATRFLINQAGLKSVRTSAGVNGLAIPTSGKLANLNNYGLRSNDIVTHINGIPVDEATGDRELLGRAINGETVKLKLQRNNQTIELEYKLGSLR